jgi:hypothetical protein
MKALLSFFLVLAGLCSSLTLGSCNSTSGLNEDGTYTAPPTVSPVDATTRMQSEFRNWRH